MATTEFSHPLDPRGLVTDTADTTDAILEIAARKYPFTAETLKAPLSMYASMFWTIYFTVTDPVLSALTETAHPEFHFWLRHYHRAFMTTRLPFGLNVFRYVNDVFSFVSQEVYLPQTESLEEPAERGSQSLTAYHP